MSIYQFVPISTIDQVHPFITWENAFSDEEIESIKYYCSTLPKQSGIVGKGDEFSEDNSIRSSNISWVANNQNSGWIYDRLAYVARSINAKFFNFDLYGFVEDFQYTEYTGDDSGHYTWHIDMSNNSTAPRKLSLVLQLTDPSEYQGGDLQTMMSAEEQTVNKQKGLISVFPSWVMHRVTPVTSGKRQTLVIWISGPSFK